MSDRRALRRTLWLLGIGVGLAWAWQGDTGVELGFPRQMMERAELAGQPPPPAALASQVQQALVTEARSWGLPAERAVKVLRADRGACQSRRIGEWRCEVRLWLECPSGAQPVDVRWYSLHTRTGWRALWPTNAQERPAASLGVVCPEV